MWFIRLLYSWLMFFLGIYIAFHFPNQKGMDMFTIITLGFATAGLYLYDMAKTYD